VEQQKVQQKNNKNTEQFAELFNDNIRVGLLGCFPYFLMILSSQAVCKLTHDVFYGKLLNYL
jgi:hypothetical protein